MEAVLDGPGRGILYHVCICVRMNKGVRVAGMIVKDTSVMYSGWSGEEEGEVRQLHRRYGCEGVVSSDEGDAETFSGLGRYLEESCVSKLMKYTPLLKSRLECTGPNLSLLVT